jgi:4-diphosphocytidyl-2-C-methyl-D-erythritol kinase
VAVIFPGVHVNTAEAFADLDARAFEGARTVNAAEAASEKWSGALKGPAAEWGEQLANDFQPHVSGRHPEIGRAIEMLKRDGAQWAMMSGSGSTVFGLFDQSPARPTDLPETWRWWAGAL